MTREKECYYKCGYSSPGINVARDLAKSYVARLIIIVLQSLPSTSRLVVGKKQLWFALL